MITDETSARVSYEARAVLAEIAAGDEARTMHLILESTGVSPVVLGVPPKTFARPTNAPFSAVYRAPKLVGETPTRATETVALPLLNCIVPAKWNSNGENQDRRVLVVWRANALISGVMKMLSLYSGTDKMSFTVTSANPNANPNSRTYTSFTDAALDVVEARIYQGIHTRSADLNGRQLGLSVAGWVFKHALTPLKHHRSNDRDDHNHGHHNDHNDHDDHNDKHDDEDDHDGHGHHGRGGRHEH